MNKKTFALTLGGAMASALTASSFVWAQENPFAVQNLSDTAVVAEADAKMPEGSCGASKMKEGKCGEAKCGANKAKMQEATSTPTDKMKEAACGGKKKEEESSSKN